MHGGNGLKFCTLMYLDHLQNWLVYGHSLLILLILALFWLSETGQIWGFRAFPREPIEGMAWNVVCYCILTTFRTDKLMVAVWWFLAATKQLYKWYFPSVRLSVCLSVRHTFLTMLPSSYHHEIFRSYHQRTGKGPCKRSRSEVKGQGHRGHNPT